MMISNVKGQFANVSGALELDEKDLTHSRVEASIEGRIHQHPWRPA